MSSLKKIIKINPELFNTSGEKTRKNREKKTRPIQPLIINSNSLKKQLLNRIKEHKRKEKIDIDYKIQQPSSSTSNTINNDTTDEFYDSINYLSSLSKKHKEDNEKKKYDANLQIKREILASKTVKNPSIYNTNTNDALFVNLELPDELKEIRPETFAENINMNKIKINYSLDEAIPYGCLKGGIKPTYRNWQTTRKKYDTPIISYVQPIPEKQSITEREYKLDMIKKKLKNQEDEKLKLVNTIPIIEPIIKPIIEPIIEEHIIIEEPTLVPIINNSNNETPQSTIADKKFVKKTIKRKYTLGKSKLYRRVSILIKDKNTRKKIITAQKELKKKPINDVKNYLKEHGLIKVGSTAPNDVIRKTFESAMMTGDVVNKNKDTLLHNFLSDTQ